ncbi:MAG: M14 family metallopeptidase [Chthoniobacterales bacterium]
MIKNNSKPRAGRPPLPDQVRDYRLLMQRWHHLVRKITPLDLSVYGEAGGYPLMVVHSARRDPLLPSFYLSAGIHGDEPAPVEGLLQWAAETFRANPSIAHWNWMIFPCLNPWGLERNVRLDAQGLDLNRYYNSRKVPQITAQLALLRGHRYDVAVSLHEDYDARGFYLYEIAAKRPHWGEYLCSECASVPPDDRRKIDGHSSRNGLIRRKITTGMMKGHPEAFRLHFRHADRTFTLETPSEESLRKRVALHREFLTKVVKKMKAEGGVAGKNS